MAARAAPADLLGRLFTTLPPSVTDVHLGYAMPPSALLAFLHSVRDGRLADLRGASGRTAVHAHSHTHTLVTPCSASPSLRPDVPRQDAGRGPRSPGRMHGAGPAVGPRAALLRRLRGAFPTYRRQHLIMAPPPLFCHLPSWPRQRGGPPSPHTLTATALSPARPRGSSWTPSSRTSAAAPTCRRRTSRPPPHAATPTSSSRRCSTTTTSRFPRTSPP